MMKNGDSRSKIYLCVLLYVMFWFIFCTFPCHICTVHLHMYSHMCPRYVVCFKHPNDDFSLSPS